ncbi:MAG TPA: type VII secretion protein EccE [Aldersonia sp.]
MHSTVVVAACLATLVALLGAALRLSPIITAAIAACVGLLAAVPIAGHSLPDWARVACRYRERARLGPLVDLPAPDGRAMGLYRDGTAVVAVLELLADSGGRTRISPESLDADQLVPLCVLADCLRQHDIRLDGIDVVSHGRRSHSGGAASAVYEQLVGPLPATAARTIWIALRFDTLRCPDAVVRRGGDTAGAIRALGIAAARTVASLAASGHRARVLTATEIRDAVLRVSAGTDPHEIGQTWNHARLGEHVDVGATIDPVALANPDRAAQILARAWVAPSLGTTTLLRLRPTPDPETVAVGAAWRRTLDAPKPRHREAGQRPVDGRHRRAVLAHLPLAVPWLEDVVGLSEVPRTDLDRLRLPAGGCGQLVGSDSDGHGVATRLVGAGVANVHLDGEPYLARQVVFRAVATGARVVVRTDREQDWAGLAAAIGDRDRLRITTRAEHSDAGFDAVMLDGATADTADTAPAGVTTLRLNTSPAPADVTIRQVGPDRVVLATRRPDGTHSRADLTLVSVPAEAEFIGRPMVPAPVG